MNKNEKLIYFIIAVCSFVQLFYIFIYPENGYVAYYEDDFFYYLKIAENFVFNGKSTFDGTHLTNGYHPLWFLVVSTLVKLTGSAELPFFILFNILLLILAILTTRYSLKLIKHYEVDSYFGYAVLLIFINRYLYLAKSGMEVALVIPLIIYLLYHVIIKINSNSEFSNKDYALYTLLSSLIILARIDAAIIVLLCTVAIFFSSKNQIKFNFSKLLYALIGLLPLFLYLATNLYYFDTLLTISSQAKQLRVNYGLSFYTISSLLPVSLNTAITFVILVSSIIGFITLNFNKSTLKVKSNFFAFSISFFFILHLLASAFLSGWQFWTWYTYSIFISFLFISLLAIKSYTLFNNRLIEKLTFIFSILFLVVWSFSISILKKPNSYSIYNNAIAISEWINQNPGIYAMGDRAGLVGYLSNYPIVQLEGLTMDKEFLNNIENQYPLNDVLKKYKVDYYITFLTYPQENLIFTYEPHPAKLAGNKYMTGKFQEPYKVFDSHNFIYSVFKVKDK